MIFIHEGNWAEFAEQAHSVPGLCGAFPRRTPTGGLYCARPYAEVMELIPESQYASRYDVMIGKFSRQQKAQHNPQLHNQGNHPLCWCFSLAQHAESVRAKMGLPYIQLAPESIAGTYGFRDQGGALDDAIAYVQSHGIAPRSMVPLYNLKPSIWSAGWEQKSLDVVPLEIYDLGTKDMYAECMTALLTGDSIYFGINWLGHAMNFEEIQKVGNEYCFWTPNTWGQGQDMLLAGRKKIPDDAFVVRQVTYAR